MWVCFFVCLKRLLAPETRGYCVVEEYIPLQVPFRTKIIHHAKIVCVVSDANASHLIVGNYCCFFLPRRFLFGLNTHSRLTQTPFELREESEVKVYLPLDGSTNNNPKRIAPFMRSLDTLVPKYRKAAGEEKKIPLCGARTLDYPNLRLNPKDKKWAPFAHRVTSGFGRVVKVWV